MDLSAYGMLRASELGARTLSKVTSLSSQRAAGVSKCVTGCFFLDGATFVLFQKKPAKTKSCPRPQPGLQTSGAGVLVFIVHTEYNTNASIKRSLEQLESRAPFYLSMYMMTQNKRTNAPWRRKASLFLENPQRISGDPYEGIPGLIAILILY